jgi:hypothetical protein
VELQGLRAADLDGNTRKLGGIEDQKLVPLRIKVQDFADGVAAAEQVDAATRRSRRGAAGGGRTAAAGLWGGSWGRARERRERWSEGRRGKAEPQPTGTASCGRDSDIQFSKYFFSIIFGVLSVAGEIYSDIIGGR